MRSLYSPLAFLSTLPIVVFAKSSYVSSVAFNSSAQSSLPVSSSVAAPLPLSSNLSSVSSNLPASSSVPLPNATALSFLSFSSVASSALPSSSLNTTNATSFSSAASPSAQASGYSQQPPGNDASPHPFTPFPTPTQQPIPGIFVSTDPSNPPPVSSDPQLIPDFDAAWQTAWSKAKARLASFSIDDKVNLATGVGWENGRCVGNTPAIPSQGWQGLCLEDSPVGVRDTDFATVFPAGINAAATWQRSLIRARGLGMGQEHKGKGVNLALGPMMNMGRVAEGGRNWEGFGADPFLTGESAYETILGMQQGGVQATAKHFINNEQEHFRQQESSNVDDRTEHEIYAHPFLRSVMAGVAAVMCSYNQINNTFACENDRTLNQILKGEFGFQGFVMSDWSATESTLSAVDGLDMTMPGDITFDSGNSWFGGNLTAFVNNGSIAEGRLDDMATRIVAAWYFLHQDEGYPGPNFNAFNPVDPATNEHVDVQDDHDQIVRAIGAASAVLLKNQNKALPLNKPRSIAIIGIDAAPPIGGPNQYSDQGGNDGILALGWGSGTANFTYLISPYEAIQARARQDRTSVNWNFNNFDTDTAGNIAIQSETAIVFINADSGEGYITVDDNAGDRKNLTAWHGGDDLILAVAAQNPNTIVVVHSVGPLIVEPWIEHPNVTAVVWAGIPGPEVGNSLVDVLYGAVNPSGRLPFTIAQDEFDYPAQVLLGGVFIDGNLQIDYTEGLFIDYRHFDAAGIEPRFEFGFGLSYTEFKYSSISVQEVQTTFSQNLVNAWKQSKPSPNGEASSRSPWLHEPAYQVVFTVQNTGSVAGTEIPQVYINHPASANEPPSILKGFTDIYLNPGQSQRVSISISRYDLSIWDVISQSWIRPTGTIKLFVGASSRDKRLFATIPN